MNVAYQLYNILDRAIKFPNPNNSDVTINVWRKILESESENDFFSLFKNYKRIVAKVHSFALSLDNNSGKNIYQSYTNPVVNFSNMNNLALPWSQVIGHINVVILNGIYTMNDLMSHSYVETLPDDGDISNWIESLEDIKNDINQDENLEIQIKLFFEEKIQEIILLLKKYELYGAEIIMDTLVASSSQVHFKIKDSNNYKVKLKRIFGTIMVSLSTLSNIAQISGYNIDNLIKDKSNPQEIFLLIDNNSVDGENII